MNIRRAVVADAAALSAQKRQASRSYLQFMSEDHWERWLALYGCEESYRLLIGDSSSVVFVYESAGQVVAQAAMIIMKDEQGRRYGYMTSNYCSVPGRGIGKSLSVAREQWAAEEGAEYLAVSVYRENRSVVDALERRGFRVDSVRPPGAGVSKSSYETLLFHGPVPTVATRADVLVPARTGLPHEALFAEGAGESPTAHETAVR